MRGFLRTTPGDPGNGRLVYNKVCGQCHKLFGEGQDVGPDISSNGRGSFEKRGRVNVGVGYAISINQIKRFLGLLKSGRIVDHATLGATVRSRADGSVAPHPSRCSRRRRMPSEAARGAAELLEALDSYIPEPKREIDKPFLMPVEDVFSITGRGTVATGRIERGIIKVGEEIALVGFGSDKKSVVTGVEMFRKLLDQGEAGDNVGLLLRGIGKEEIERGMVLAKPGSITPHTHFMAEVYVLTKEEGGRHTPFFKGYRPQFYFRTTDVTGSVELPEGTEMVMPGDNVQMTIELITPIAMDEGLRFAIREGGRTVGAGVVTEIIA